MAHLSCWRLLAIARSASMLLVFSSAGLSFLDVAASGIAGAAGCGDPLETSSVDVGMGSTSPSMVMPYCASATEAGIIRSNIMKALFSNEVSPREPNQQPPAVGQAHEPAHHEPPR